MPFDVMHANQILDYMFSKTNTSINAYSQVYMGLSRNDPEADAGIFNELDATTCDNYERVLISIKNETYPDFMGKANNRTIKNVKQINFNRNRSETDAWDTIKGFGLFSAKTGGTPFYYAKVDREGGVEVPPNAVALFDPNTLVISFSSTDA